MTAERVTRGRMGRIDALDAELQALVNRYLRTGLPQTEVQRRINAELKKAGEKPISYSSLNRYSARMEAHGRRMREAREMARMWTSRGGEEGDDDLTALMVHMLQTAAYDGMVRAESGSGDPADPDTINRYSLALQRLARAKEISARREREIREEAIRDTERQAKRAMEREAKKRGLAPHLVEALAHVIGTATAGEADDPRV